MTTKRNDIYVTARYFARRKGWQDTSKLYSKSVLLSRSRTGTSVEHWKDKIRQHQDASSALSGTYQSLEDTAASMQCVYRVDGTGALSATGKNRVTETVNGYLSSYLGNFRTPSFAWSSVADGRARNKFLSNVRKEQTKMQGAVFLKEIDQTWHMLHRPASALWQHIGAYYAALKRAKRRSPLGWYTAIPSLWLEYSFGWRPLMMDIDDAFDALNSLTELDSVHRVTGSGKDERLVEQTTGSNTYQPECARLAYKWRAASTEQETVKYVGGVRFQATTTFADKAAQWGFTPAEFLPSAWEILPWSFLVDYFVTIGDYLDASFANTSNIVWCVKTSRKMTERKLVLTPDRSNTQSLCGVGYVSSYGQTSVSKYRWRTVSRQVVNGNSITPALYVKWSGPTSGQFANISALFGQASTNLHSQRYSGKTYRLR